MLTYLKVKNFAIIDQVEIDFQEGFNVLTGETGAGKSIIIKALQLLLGERATSDIIRTGESECEVQAIFSISKNQLKILQKYDLISDKDSELIIRRIISIKGTNKIFINNNIVSLSILGEITSFLLNICGQHAHQNLTDLENQLNIIDSFCDHNTLLIQISEYYSKINNIDSRLETLDIDPKLKNQRIDYLTYQLKEINEVNPSLNEEEELEEQSKKMAGMKDLGDLCEEITEVLYGEEFSVINPLESIIKKIKYNLKFDKGLSEIQNTLENAIEQLESVGDFISKYSKKMNLDDDKINELIDRIESIKLLKKKYGKTVQEILDKKEELENELSSLLNIDKNIESLKKEKKELIKKYEEIALKLHNNRIKKSKEIADKVTLELQELNMKGSKFVINISKSNNLRSHGTDNVSFDIMTNKGEEVKPLNKIVSGGELSRIMLAITKVITEKSHIGLYIFDEIDSGIGGDTGTIIGKKLMQVSKTHQVICITHLAQVAVFGDTQFLIEKKELNKRTVSSVLKINDDNIRIQEISRMLGGDFVKNKGLEHATAMFTEAKKNTKLKK